MLSRQTELREGTTGATVGKGWESQTAGRDSHVPTPPLCLALCPHLQTRTYHLHTLPREKFGRGHLRHLLDTSFSLTPKSVTKPCCFCPTKVSKPPPLGLHSICRDPGHFSAWTPPVSDHHLSCLSILLHLPEEPHKSNHTVPTIHLLNWGST